MSDESGIPPSGPSVEMLRLIDENLCLAKENSALKYKTLGADRLADEVAALVTRGVIDSRSPVADALLDYREPPRTERSDRLAKLEKEPARIRQALLAEAKCSCSQYGESLADGAGEFDRSESRNPDGSDRYVDGERVWPRIVRHHSWCPIALVNRIIPEER